MAPSYPASQAQFFHQFSAEETEESEYLRALEVVANHRRRRIAEEAAFRRQQQAEAARQRYFAALAAELEQQRQEESLAVRRAEFVRSQPAIARSIAAERQHALNVFLRQLEGTQSVCHVCIVATEDLALTRPSPQIIRQPHVAKRKPVVDTLKQRLATESDADISESIQNILSSLEPRPVQSEEPEVANEDVAQLVKNILSSIFPGLAFHTQPQATPTAEEHQPSVTDKGKGKARAADVEETRKPAPKPESAGEAFADLVRHVMELSKSTPAPRSSSEAGPSGSSSSPSPANLSITGREQAQINRAIALSSIEHVQDTLVKLQTQFVLPAGLDHHTPSADDHDETASVVSTSSSDLTKLIPYTRANKPVYKYENELSGLLEELDRIDSHGDAEVREKRKEVVKAVEKALEGVERMVSEAVEKKLSLSLTTIPVAGIPLKGFDVDGELIEEASRVPEHVDAPVVVDGLPVPEPSTSVQVEDPLVVPAEAPSSVASDGCTDLPSESTFVESDIEASTATITPGSVEFTSVAETEPIKSQAPADAPESVDTFLLPEKVSSPSPVKKLQEIDSDTDEEVLALDSDVEKSDWSEVEH